MANDVVEDWRATIAFIASAYLGHFYPTVELARALVREGYSVLYLLIEDDEAIKRAIEDEGLKYVDISDRLEVERLTLLMKQARLCAARSLLWEQVDMFGELTERYHIKAVLVDNFVRYVAVLATLNRVSAVSLCFNYNENVHVSRTLATGDINVGDCGQADRRPLRTSWQWSLALLLDRWLGVQASIARFAARQKLETDVLMYNQMRVFTYPTLYFAPKELLRPSEERGLYLGLCLGGRRRWDDRMGDEARENGRRLVYVSLGTLNHQHPGSLTFFRRAVEAFASDQRLEVVLHVGAGIDPRELGPTPSHIAVHQSVAQMALIEKARLVITHGGLGTIKECIHFGVPMLLMPLTTEQLDNARRVVARRMGLLADVATIDADGIRGLAQRVLADHRFTTRVRQLRAAIAENDGFAAGLDLVVSLASPCERPPGGRTVGQRATAAAPAGS